MAETEKTTPLRDGPSLPREGVLRALKDCGAVIDDQNGWVELENRSDQTIREMVYLGDRIPHYVAIRLANKFGASPHSMFH